jgi:hypothetical protein
METALFSISHDAKSNNLCFFTPFLSFTRSCPEILPRWTASKRWPDGRATCVKLSVAKPGTWKSGTP